MADLDSRYALLMEQMSKLYEKSHAIAEQLRRAVITAESWDEGRGGGHLRFTVSPEVAPIEETDWIEVWARDSDNAPIQIIWHVVDGRLNWGEWIKLTGTPIDKWPPREVSATPPTYSANDMPNLKRSWGHLPRRRL